MFNLDYDPAQELDALDVYDERDEEIAAEADYFDQFWAWLDGIAPAPELPQWGDEDRCHAQAEEFALSEAA